LPSRGGLFAQTLIPVCRGPSKVEDIIFQKGGQFFYPAPEHLLKTLGDVFLPCAVHTDALHTVAVSVTAHLHTGAVIHLHRQAFGDGGLFGAAFHGTLHRRISLRHISFPPPFSRGRKEREQISHFKRFLSEEQSFSPLALLSPHHCLQCASDTQIEDRMP
jgi:hypothetical protein